MMITTCGAFLIIARGILEDVAAAEGFTITTSFNQIKCLNFIITSRVVLIVCCRNIIGQFFENTILTILKSIRIVIIHIKIKSNYIITKTTFYVRSSERNVVFTSTKPVRRNWCTAATTSLLKLIVSGEAGAVIKESMYMSSPSVSVHF